MKKLFCFLFALIPLIYANAQNDYIPPTSQDSVPTETIVSTSTPGDSISLYIASLLEDVSDLKKKDALENRYKMYQTENIYNLLKLDTQTGKIEQVQWM